MSAQRWVTAPPCHKAEVVTESVRVVGLRTTVDPFREAPPLFAAGSAATLTRRIPWALPLSNLILSGSPGTGVFPF
jgi:hypothetical protein